MAVTTTSVTTTSTPAKFSWADIVKGSTTPTPPAALRPAARGEKRCYCQGEILVMLGHYGWIMTFDDIEHPDIGMTAGRVYIHQRDVVDGASLAQGDTVSFYLYADEQGLGAECCKLEKSASQMSADADEFVPADDGFRQSHEATSFKIDANEFVPSYTGSTVWDGSSLGWNVGAAEFVPITPAPFSKGLSVEATEFVPSQFNMMNSCAEEFMPADKYSGIGLPNPNVFIFNPAFLSDDESDDESSIVASDDMSGNDGDKESDDSDKESSCDESLHSFQQDKDFESGSDLDVLVLHAPLKSQASSEADSTSVGATSDSDEEHTVHCAVRAPPGLSLPAGWRPPPGLSLPVFVS